ncbi:MAG: ATP-dependent 6-phosphofructokinase [Acidobacteriota bacterium]
MASARSPTTSPALPSRAALDVDRLGDARFGSPWHHRRERFVTAEDRVLVCSTAAELQPFLEAGEAPPSFEAAGARSEIFFDPSGITCGLVSCGGLCPGINNVIRSIVLSLTWGYGVRRILGFRYGFAGVAGLAGEPMELTAAGVEPIHEEGGTLLGSSRGPQDVGRMVDELERRGVSILFTIGGDGTLRGAGQLAAEIGRRRLPIAVIGVPKTIDNDIRWIERSFGFATAVDEACRVIDGAHAEARGALGGIGLVKLMGRHSGFITAHAALAKGDVNFCLVPEVPFRLDGAGGLIDALEARLAARQHAVIVVAEGAGQEWLAAAESPTYDASGNRKLGDIGPFLKDSIKSALRARGVVHTIKYIDPSYTVRSLPANAMDAEYSLMLGQHAVHAGMAGRTNLVVGQWNRHFTHVPIALATDGRKVLDPHGGLWHRVLEATGQPASMVDADGTCRTELVSP